MTMPIPGVSKANLELNLRTKFYPQGDTNCQFYAPLHDSDLRDVNAGVYTISIPIILAGVTAADVLTNYTPGYKFKLLSASFAVTVPVTTAAKAATLNLEIGTTNVTGGEIALTSANCATLGALVAGSAITAANSGSITDTISVEAATVTAFAEGQGILLLKIQNMDVIGSGFISKDKNAHICTVTAATWGTKGRTFAGAGYIGVAVSAALQPVNVTVLLWAKPTSDVANMIPFSMPYHNVGWSAPYVAYSMSRSNPNGGYNFHADINVAGTIRAVESLILSPINVWKRYGLTFDGTTLRTYVNGVAGATGAWTGDITYGTSPALAIGARSIDSLGSYWIGDLDEPLVYDRVLTAAEMADDYLATKWRYGL